MAARMGEGKREILGIGCLPDFRLEHLGDVAGQREGNLGNESGGSLAGVGLGAMLCDSRIKPNRPAAFLLAPFPVSLCRCDARSLSVRCDVAFRPLVKALAVTIPPLQRF